VAAISRIWPESTHGSPLEYGPRAGKKFDAISNGAEVSGRAQWWYAPSWAAVPYHG
jgi:hypothetical protein